jgi:UDP-N-acetylmuramoyl-L-alanyl-D-glutamate--2,6-diaminopimelate ligase
MKKYGLSKEDFNQDLSEKINEDSEVMKFTLNYQHSVPSAKNFEDRTNRKQAIKAACQVAQANDIILIAGKGHETYQEINGVRHDFDDMKIVKEMLDQLNK